MRIMSAPGGVLNGEPDGQVVVAPWQSLDLAALNLTVDDVTTAAYWVDPDGTLFRGHDAIAKSLKFTGMPWVVAGTILAAPPVSWLAAPVYSLVAKYRYRLPGSTDACKIPQ